MYSLFLSLPLWDLPIIMPELGSLNWNMGELGFKLSVFWTQCLKKCSCSLADLRSVLFGFAFPPSSALAWLYSHLCVCSVMLEIHGIRNVFLCAPVKEVNSPEGCPVEVRDRGTRAFLITLCWVYISVYVCRHMGFPTFLFVYSRVTSKVSGISWKYFYFIKRMREGFSGFSQVFSGFTNGGFGPSLRGALWRAVMREWSEVQGTWLYRGLRSMWCDDTMEAERHGQCRVEMGRPFRRASLSTPMAAVLTVTCPVS